MAVSPASTLTSTGSIAHQATVYYDRLSLDNLKKALRFNQLTEPRRLPKQFGLTTQMFRYIPFAANTSAGAEGTIGSGIAPTTETVSATISQYFDFVNFSDLYLETVIDDALTNVAEEMGYRAGLTVDTLIRTTFDSGSATTSAATIGAALAANDFRKQVQSLRGNDVKPKEGSDFLSLAHPFTLYDLISDNTAGGFIDVNTFASQSYYMLETPKALPPDKGIVADMYGIMPSMDNQQETWRAWLAAHLDSDGWIGFNIRQRHKTERGKVKTHILPWASFSNNSKELVEKFAQVANELGIGCLVNKAISYTKTGNKHYSAHVAGMKRVNSLLPKIRPYLVAKQDRLKHIQAFIDSRLSKPLSNPYTEEEWRHVNATRMAPQRLHVRRHKAKI